jgi:predicted PhzF superfamily epimerase YddE/YHI9
MVCFVPPGRPPPSTAWMSHVAVESGQPTTTFVDEASNQVVTYNNSGDELPLLSVHSSLGVAAAVRAARRGEGFSRGVSGRASGGGAPRQIELGA